ncbi:phytoene desaturase family protein [Aureispira anguillae]|uniref:NAD(P)/FAD-dependent oxidoreductase n=1 Tax=Aureispira anguillae TaxID=2864201 RepID=A0A916DS36_9BACT|nr:NAD(P)/FAD-dependent oxidoreductase [Aureispira anguillae]BDS11631.1 NAD(P)/FAD-dependent oxidoreductase [Aureispira anguillae]
MNEIVAKSEYDVVIIGAGVSGMTAAALLSRTGLSVCVVEKEPHAGGYLAGFRRKEFRFDSAIHWLNQCGKKGIVTRVFQFIGEDRPQAQPMKRIYRNKTEKFDYVLTDNPDELKEQLIADFPHEKAGIEQFFDAAKKIARTWDLHAENFRATDTMSWMDKISNGLKKLSFIRPLFRYIWYHGEEGVPKGLNLFFKDPELHRYWASEHDLLSCLLPIAWAYLGDYQLPPAGGSQVFIEWLVHVTEYYRNDIVYGATVQEILLENGICKGLVFERKGSLHKVKSKQVIAACDVEMLYEKLLPKESIPQKLKDNLKSAELYSSAVAISMALDCPTEDLGFGEELIMIQKEGISRTAHDSGDPHTTAISIIPPSLRDKSLAPDGKGTLTVYSAAHIDYKNYWGCTLDEKGNYVRTDEYYQLKEEFAAIIIDRIEERLGVDLKSHILFLDVASPITHWRYSYNRGGSIMGARPGRANMEAKIAHYKTPVKNLLLGGHWADLGGGVPIAVKSAANAALIVMKEQKPKAFEAFAKYADGKINQKEAHKTGFFEAYDNSWVQKRTPAETERTKRK